MAITKDTIIADVIKDHPEAAKVFFENGFGCLGCAMAKHESIEQGAKAHGMDDKSIEKIIKDINKIVT
jgi:hybrid cluster-associated redox disulfide protein